MKASKNPVKALYGSAMLIGAVVGLGCGAGKAFSKDAATSPVPKPHFRPHIGAYVALQNVRERQELLKIYDDMLGQLRQRAAVSEAKNDLRAQGIEPESQPLRTTPERPTPKQVASDPDDIAPTLVIGAQAVQRSGSVETVKTRSVETPAYPAQSEPSEAFTAPAPDSAPATPTGKPLGARFARNEAFRGLKPAWKRFTQR